MAYKPGYFEDPVELLARALEAYTADIVSHTPNATNEFITKGDRAYLEGADARLAMTFPQDKTIMQDVTDPDTGAVTKVKVLAPGDRFAIWHAMGELKAVLQREQLLGKNAPPEGRDGMGVVSPTLWLKHAAPDVSDAEIEEARRAILGITQGFTNALDGLPSEYTTRTLSQALGAWGRAIAYTPTAILESMHSVWGTEVKNALKLAADKTQPQDVRDAAAMVAGRMQAAQTIYKTQIIDKIAYKPGSGEHAGPTYDDKARTAARLNDARFYNILEAQGIKAGVGMNVAGLAGGYRTGRAEH